MALTEMAMGELIEQVASTNFELKYGLSDVRGMTITKEIIPTKANLQGTTLDRFIVVKPHEFIYNPRTHGKKIGLGYNATDNDFIISWNNIGFKVKKSAKGLISPDYLYLHFNRSEWDREACFNSWGSSTEVFSWETFCEMTIVLPPFEVQQKYAEIYWGVKDNIDALTHGIEQMQAACNIYMESLLKTVSKQPIGDYISEIDERNSDELYGLDNLRGISIEKKFIETKANMQGVSLQPYKVIAPGTFCYVPVTSRNGDKVSLALNESTDTYIVSSSYVSFRVVCEKLQPQYLFMFLRNPDFDRFARFNSWGSARETFALEDLGHFEIPIPSIEIQQNIINIFNAMNERRRLCERLVSLQKRICPILIKGAIEEGGRT
ncbi:MAG: restriction endonuclease subunit S [Clostridium sp.]|nr:restriction endonuclease subunit S [Clostridium sp.]